MMTEDKIKKLTERHNIRPFGLKEPNLWAGISAIVGIFFTITGLGLSFGRHHAIVWGIISLAIALPGLLYLMRWLFYSIPGERLARLHKNRKRDLREEYPANLEHWTEYL